LPLVSIVVPVLDDLDAARALLFQLDPDARVETVLVDGGYDAGLESLVEGRPRQMNAGAACTSGTWLLFLHTDSRLPTDWLVQIAALPPDVGGGWFRFGLDDPAWQARIIERGVAWRVRMLRLPYGDQGIVVRRDTFGRLGGFRDMPLMEDVDFVRRLTRSARIVELQATLLTSSRRWRRDGWLARSARNVALVSLYFAGIPPARLARWYAARRDRSGQ